MMALRDEASRVGGARLVVAALTLALLAVAFELVIGVVAGVLTGLKRGGFLDNLVLVSTLVVVSIPVFVIGVLAQLAFGVKLGWFEVLETRGHVENGLIAHYQVTLKVGFALDE